MSLIGQRKRRLVRAALILAAMSLACDRSGNDKSAVPTGRFVAFVGVGADDPQWLALSRAVQRLHTAQGIRHVPLRVEAPPNSSVEAQKKILQELAGEAMAAVCVQVSDPAGLSPALDHVAAGGIKTITMMGRPVAGTPLAHVGMDEPAAGVAMADALNEALGDRNTAALVHADSFGGPFPDRRKAFLDRMAAYPNRKILFQHDCGNDSGAAMKFIRETMPRYPRMGAWVLLGSWLGDAGTDNDLVPDGCRMVTVGPYPAVWPKIESGMVYAAVGTDYGEIAERALGIGVSAAMGFGDAPTSFFAPPITVTAANLDEFKKQWGEWTAVDPETPD